MASKKKMKKDFGDIDHFDDEEITDSDDEFSDTEKQMLEKVRKKRVPENFDSDDEVYGLNLDDDENEHDDSMDSDIDRPQEDDDLPDDRAWGKQKRTFYSTDYVDPDYATTNEKNMAAAELEEQEGQKIHERLVDQMDEAAFGLDLLPSKPDTEEAEKSAPILEENLSKLSKREKKELLKQESPELEGLINDLKERLGEAKDTLSPFLKLAESKNFPNTRAINFIRTKYHLVLNYCVNISFYLMLKAKKIPITHHPVIKRLAQYRKLLVELEERQGDFLIQVSELLEADREGKPLYNILDNTEIQTSARNTDSKKKSNKKKQEIPISESADEEANDEDVSMDEDLIDEDEEMGENEVAETHETLEDQKRAISYQIAKNRGLTPHRKKELRNPRVKHRNKYRKAKIRRKGAVREVRKETTRYAGELSGIKATTKKSIKLK